MATRHYKAKYNVRSIIEAVDILERIADMDLEHDNVLVKRQEILESLEGHNSSDLTILWLLELGDTDTTEMMREVFHSVLDYIRNFYRSQQMPDDPYTIEGIQNIMVLVGEAVKKLDRFNHFFIHKNTPSVATLVEYQSLHQFYQKRISTKVDEGLLGKWILGLLKNVERAVSGPAVEEKFRTEHVFIDLELIKKDLEYELFFLRKEDGTRFINPRLIRNMKVVCDFGNYFSVNREEDPLSSLKIWQDRCCQATAQGIVKSIGTRLDHFFKDSAKHRDQELTRFLTNALMALMLSSHSRNLMQNNASKSCYELFVDFQKYMALVFHCREYQKLIAYPPDKSDRFSNLLLEIINSVCRGLFVHGKGYYEMLPVIQDMFREANEDAHYEKNHKDKPVYLWQHLSVEYDKMKKLMKRHPNGHIINLLDQFEDGSCNVFEPIRQFNQPTIQYAFHLHDKKIVNIRMPTPTTQESINKASPLEEFYGFLRACQSDHIKRKHLLINLQDRTSWRESARCHVLEDLSNHNGFKDHLTVVSLATDTEFYHQLPPYEKERMVEVFMQHFYDQLKGEESGFYFPEELKKVLFPDFAKRLMEDVHRIFFASKKLMGREERLDFIEIYYFFLTMKILETVEPDSFSFTCKDALDIGQSLGAFLVIFQRLINERQLSVQELECVRYMLYAPALLVRERLMLHDRFERMVNAVKRVEELQREDGQENFALIIKEAFGPLYKTSILNAQFSPPKP